MTPEPSALTLGTSGLGRDTVPGSPEEHAAVQIAVDLFASDHTFLDTSNNYADGRSEAVIGLALQAVGADHQARVVSKVDEDPTTRVFDRERVLRSCEETLDRLGVDRLPLLHLHDPYSVTFEQATSSGGAVAGLIELREQNVVGAIGVAAAPIPLMARYVETGAFDAVLIHNRFTLVDQSAAPVFAAARDRGMTVFNAAPFGSGLLVKGPHGNARYNYRPVPDDLLRWTRRLERICADHDVPMAAVALHFSARSPLVDSTVVGVSSQGRSAELDALWATAVPDEVWDAVDALGRAPSPIDDSAYA